MNKNGSPSVTNAKMSERKQIKKKEKVLHIPRRKVLFGECLFINWDPQDSASDHRFKNFIKMTRPVFLRQCTKGMCAATPQTRFV